LSKFYALTGPNPEDPTYLIITTTDDGLLEDMAIPSYRASDAITQNLLAAWHEYADASGSPSVDQDILQFKDWITTNYGADRIVVLLGEGAI
jgi:hypothetical protein